MPINFILLIGSLWIIFSSKKWCLEYKQKKHLLPNKRILFLQVSKPLLLAIPISLFLPIIFTNLVLLPGLICSFFQFWKVLHPELQKLYFRPKGKKAVYLRFIEAIIFTVIFVITYGIIYNRLNIKFF
jgi:hypothetical protein